MDYAYFVSLWGILSNVTGLLQYHFRQFITLSKMFIYLQYSYLLKVIFQVLTKIIATILKR